MVCESVCVSKCESVCVCVRARKRERDRETESLCVCYVRAHMRMRARGQPHSVVIPPWVLYSFRFDSFSQWNLEFTE